ncbi:MAG: DUF5131 family protein [Magnetococcales bacterium]|nr:DUF5131 family protein [Magnetococcales bacterium]
MSAISWTDKTLNTFVGCSKAGTPGCDNCYAVGIASWQTGLGVEHYEGTTIRKKGELVWTGVINRAHDGIIYAPTKRRIPTLYFVGSMTDFFHPNADDSLRLEVLDLIEQCPQHIFQFLTKRPENILPFLERTGVEFPGQCWVGTTVENRRAKTRIATLRSVPGVKRFLSIEPLLEDLGKLELGGIDWVIVGGESGPSARPIDVDWVRRIRRQCCRAGVPFYLKQWGVPENNPLAEETPLGVTVP